MISLDYLEKQLEFLKKELQKLDVSQRDEKTRAAEKPPAYEITIGGVNFPPFNLNEVRLKYKDTASNTSKTVDMNEYFETSSSPKYISGKNVSGNAWRWYSTPNNLLNSDPNLFSHGPDYNEASDLWNYSITIVSKASEGTSADLHKKLGGAIDQIHLVNRPYYQNRIWGRTMTIKKDGVLQDITNIPKESQSSTTQSCRWTFDGTARSFYKGDYLGEFAFFPPASAEKSSGSDLRDRQLAYLITLAGHSNPDATLSDKVKWMKTMDRYFPTE